MHKLANEIIEKLTKEVENVGVENFCGQNLDDFKDWTEIIKNCLVIDAMEEETQYGMSVEEYRKNPAEYYRDMDKTAGLMYYTENSRYESAVSAYKNAKGNESMSDESKLKLVDNIATVIGDDIKSWIPVMSSAERTMLRQKLINITNGI